MNSWQRLGLYIHVPYCLQRCAYCDFFTLPLTGPRDAQFGPYLEALRAEFESVAAGFEGREIDSIFFGGGTPSLLRPEEVHQILELCTGALPPRGGSLEAIEVTLEVNPDTMDRGKARALLDAGINRMSMGVQSLDDASLKLLGRHHDAAGARRCYEDIRAAGCANVSLDMIYGRPGLSAAAWERELDALLAWAPDNLSLYELILEPGTPMTRAIHQGELELPSEDERWQMFSICRQRTKAAGMEWYEISNYSRPGFEARHNLDNWRGGEYLGVGPGAHSFRATPGLGARRANPRNMPMYLEAPHAAPWKERNPREVRQDALLNGLRIREGTRFGAPKARYGIDIPLELEPRIAPLLQAEYLEVHDGNWRLSTRGAELLDSVLSHLDSR